VRFFTHWEHAQHIVVEETGLEGQLALLCYTALLRSWHGDDPRVDEALVRGQGLVRMEGYWATTDMTRPHALDGLVHRLARLPAVLMLFSDEHGPRLEPDTERLGIFRGVDDLSAYGYPRIQPVRGMKIFHHWMRNTDPHVVRAAVLPEPLRPEHMAPYRPRYVEKNRRMLRADAEAVVNQSFPGINHAYLRLLIAARGCAEGGVGQPPMIAVDGPSGAGKSLTVQVAAALIGDNHQDVPWNSNLERYHMDLHAASLNAGLVPCDEIIKLAQAQKVEVLTALSSLLSFTQGTTVRKLYVGPVVVRHVPVLVITDITFPRELLCDEQLGRRFVHVHLDRKVDWKRSYKQKIAAWRTLHRDHAAAANAIVSEVIDEFFAGDDDDF
jgi:hypothetical protein